VVRAIVLAREAREAEYDRDVRLAWYVVRIYAEAKTKRLPSLTSLLQKGPPPKQTVEDQRRVVESLARMYGGRVRKVKKPHG
jgi:hypothetical protein